MKRILVIVLLLVSTLGFGQQVDVRRNATYFSKGIECKYKEDVNGAILNFENALRYMPDDAASMFELSEQYVKVGRVEDAFRMIQRAVETDPDNKWYQLRLGRFYRNFEQYDDFIRLYESLTTKYPDNVDMLSELIDVYLITENYNKALAKLDLLERQVGHNTMIREQRVEIYKRQGKNREVVAELQRLIEENPENTRYYHMLANVYMENGKEKEAVKLYERIKEIDPNDPYINISLLEYYEKKGDLDRAFEELIAAIHNTNLDFNTKANIYDYWFSKATDSEKVNQQAFRAGQAFMESYPDNKMGYLILASYYMNLKDYRPCRDMASKALEIEPSNFAGWQHLVLCDVSLQETDSLMVHSTKALQFYPTQPIFYWFAGVSYALDKQDAEAISYFERGRRFVADQKLLVDFDSYLGDLYHSVGDSQKSFEAYERVLRNDPDNALVLNNYAYYLSLRGEQLDKAKTMASRAVELDPDNPVYLDTYAWVLYTIGEYEAAEVQMEKAIKQLKTPDKTYYQHYADILAKVNKPEKAQEYRNKAQALTHEP